MSFKEKVKEFLGFGSKADTTSKDYSYCLQDYTALLGLVNCIPFDGEEYYLVGFGGSGFEDICITLSFNPQESSMLKTFGNTNKPADMVVIEQAVRKCTRFIDKFNLVNKGNDILYGETLYDEGRHLAEGWKLFHEQGQWKLCLSYRLI